MIETFGLLMKSCEKKCFSSAIAMAALFRIMSIRLSGFLDILQNTARQFITFYYWNC